MFAEVVLPQKQFLLIIEKVKDFATNASSKKNKRKSKQGFISKRSFKYLSFGLGLFFIGLMIRNIHFGDFVSNHAKQTILVVSREVDSSPAYLVEADFSQLYVNVYPLDTSVEIEVGEYGDYRFQAIYPLLASFEKKPLNLVRSTYSFTLGTVVDDVWPVSETLAQWDRKNNFRKLLFSKEILELPSSMKTKFSWIALMSDSRTEVNIHDTQKDFPLKKKLAITDTNSFLCSIALVNTTSMSGLAGRIDSVLSQDGFSVIRIGNDEDVLERTEIVVSSDPLIQNNCQKAREKTEKLLPGSISYKEDDQVVQQYRADIVIKLGVDMDQ